MKIPATGRNDPCPCGSGKKLKKCCLLKQEGMQFGSLNEVRTFVGRHTQQRNQRPLDEFHGLSPEQMHRLLHFPFTSPELVCFPELLDTKPTAPIVTLLGMLLEATGEKGLKPTAKGNLPDSRTRGAHPKIQGQVHSQPQLPHAAGRERAGRTLPPIVQGVCRTIQLELSRSLP